jgi:Flp pilus assembly protein TadG
MTGFLRRLAADRRGVSAIEFALIFPVIFVLHIAAAEALQVYQAQRNVAHIAAAMADITAQNRAVDTEELDDILAASTSMLHPFPLESLQQRISSLSASSGGSVRVDWSVKKDYSASGGPSVPDGYLAAGESVIVTDVIYDYRPSFGFFLPDTIRMTRHAYVRPRLVLKIDKVG